MSFENFLDILKDSVIDSLKVLVIVLIFNIIIALFENRISKSLSQNNKYAPLIGAVSGLIPQCGISVVASDLYLKRHITVGTLIAVFLACSDEAIPILLAGGQYSALSLIPLILIKLFVGFISGFLIDLILTNKKKKVIEHLEHCEHEEETNIGCCHHKINDEKESKLQKFFVHPLLHSLKLFAYVLVINIIFGLIIFFISEEVLISFLQTNKYIAPLFATLIGLIPNCVSSVIISELFIIGGLSFGATLAGLLVNAGLGLVFLFKSKNGVKNNFEILGTLISISLFVGYVTCLIAGF